MGILVQGSCYHGVLHTPGGLGPAAGQKGSGAGEGALQALEEPRETSPQAALAPTSSVLS